MKTYYMLRRKSDGLFHVSNWRSPAKMGKLYLTKGACKNGYNAMMANRRYGMVSENWEIIGVSLNIETVEPFPATP